MNTNATNNQSPRRQPLPVCSSCRYYTPISPTAGTCQPPVERGGEPFAVFFRPSFPICHMASLKQNTPEK